MNYDVHEGNENVLIDLLYKKVDEGILMEATRGLIKDDSIFHNLENDAIDKDAHGHFIVVEDKGYFRIRKNRIIEISDNERRLH